MQDPAHHSPRSGSSEARCVNGTEPEWTHRFLSELRCMSLRGHVDVTVALDLAGVSKPWAYRYRVSKHGQAFRIEWDTIILQARRLHSQQHR